MTIAATPTIESLTGWETLDPKTQTTIRNETQSVIESLHNEGQSRLAVGEHLFNIQQILQPRHLFKPYMEKFLHMASSTVYHYIAQYQLAKNKLPAQVISIAMQRGINIKARTLKAIAETPPPRTDDPQKIDDYLRGLRKPPIKESSTYETSEFLKDCIRFIALRYKDLPQHSKAKVEAMRQLIGMEMSMIGVSEQSFIPVAIPYDLVARRGRPTRLAA